MCYVADNKDFPPGYSSPVPISGEIISAYRCYCNAENELLNGLKKIVAIFCSQNPRMSCRDLDKALKRLCEQYHKSINACKDNHTVPSLVQDFGANCIF